jgi:hypothetical protein
VPAVAAVARSGGREHHLAVGQKVDRPLGGHVDHDGAIDMAEAQRESGQSEDRKSGDLHVGKTAQQARIRLSRLEPCPTRLRRALVR